MICDAHHGIILAATTMHNPNASINDLFDRTRDNFQCYKIQQQLKRKQLHPLKMKSQPTPSGKVDANHAQFRDAPNFKPASEFTTKRSSSSYCGSRSNPAHLVEEGRDESNDESKKRAYDALTAYLQSGDTSEAKENKPSTSFPIPKRLQLSGSVSACEMQRREVVCASLRAARTKLYAKPKIIKPLSWRKPSFRLPPTTPNADRSKALPAEHCAETAQSSAQPMEKRKEQSGATEMETDVVEHQRLETVASQAPRTASSPSPHQKLSSSSGLFSRSHCAEMTGLVEFADKWLAPLQKRQKG